MAYANKLNRIKSKLTPIKRSKLDKEFSLGIIASPEGISFDVTTGNKIAQIFEKLGKKPPTLSNYVLYSMNSKEKEDPSIVLKSGSRIRRIARGSGTSVKVTRDTIKRYANNLMAKTSKKSESMTNFVQEKLSVNFDEIIGNSIRGALKQILQKENETIIQLSVIERNFSFNDVILMMNKRGKLNNYEAGILNCIVQKDLQLGQKINDMVNNDFNSFLMKKLVEKGYVKE